MANKLKNLLFKVIIPILFWLAIWQISAMIVNQSFLLPGIPDTLSSLLKLLCSAGFYTAVLLSALRVITGLLIGIFVGILMAVVCLEIPFVKSLFTPLVRVIKSTPVASFIVVLWVLMSGDSLSVFIGFLMVMPIIYQNVSDGILSIDKELLEVAEVFEFSK